LFQDFDNAWIPVLELVQDNRRVDIDDIVVTSGMNSWLSRNKIVKLSLTDRVCDNKVSSANPTSGLSATGADNVDVLLIPRIAALVFEINQWK
jgi:hypothetical protein